jgi:preprotein translocase subunit SecD
VASELGSKSVRVVFFGAALLASVVVAVAEPLTLHILNATVTDVFQGGPGEPAGLSITLQPESTAAFAAFTAANIGKQIELRLDGKAVLSGVIGEAITNGRVRVGGNFTRQELKEFANRTPDGGFVMQAEVVAP